MTSVGPAGMSMAQRSSDLELGGRDPGVAGPHDLVDAGDRLGPVGERADGLGAAHDPELVDLHEPGRAEQGRGERRRPRPAGLATT